MNSEGLHRLLLAQSTGSCPGLNKSSFNGLLKTMRDPVYFQFIIIWDVAAVKMLYSASVNCFRCAAVRLAAEVRNTPAASLNTAH